ncbi:hypothetical protein ACFQZE_14465 [Paenibacillus sp. GCM10027627]
MMGFDFLHESEGKPIINIVVKEIKSSNGKYKVQIVKRAKDGLFQPEAYKWYE